MESTKQVDRYRAFQVSLEGRRVSNYCELSYSDKAVWVNDFDNNEIKRFDADQIAYRTYNNGHLEKVVVEQAGQFFIVEEFK